MSSGIHLDLSADSPDAMRELFALCMAQTDTLYYDGKLVRGPRGGAGQVYVFGETCPDCEGRGWHWKKGVGSGTRPDGVDTCTTCNGRKEVGPAWVTAGRTT